MGTKNPTAIEEISAIHPMNIGKIAPPTIAITINDEAFLVFSPKSLIPKAKMVGNMIDIRKNTRNKDIIETHPQPKLTIGNKKQQILAYIASILVGFTYRISQLPETLPIINNPKPPIPSIKAAVLLSK